MSYSQVKAGSRIEVIIDKNEERKFIEQIKNGSRNNDRVPGIKVKVHR